MKKLRWCRTLVTISRVWLHRRERVLWWRKLTIYLLSIRLRFPITTLVSWTRQNLQVILCQQDSDNHPLTWKLKTCQMMISYVTCFKRELVSMNLFSPMKIENLWALWYLKELLTPISPSKCFVTAIRLQLYSSHRRRIDTYASNVSWPKRNCFTLTRDTKSKWTSLKELEILRLKPLNLIW